MTIYTIGYSDRTIEDFYKLLKKHKINAVCDVRSYPSSKTNSLFEKSSIRNYLTHKGIYYIFMGNQLGARPEEDSYYVQNKVSFDKIKNSDNFKTGINRLFDGMRKGFNIALMCSEKNPNTCHRALFITNHLRKSGISITHIVDDSTEYDQEAIDQQLLSANSISIDLLGETEKEEIINNIYAKELNKIAFKRNGGNKNDDDQHIHNRND